jgi:hypothetical protein
LRGNILVPALKSIFREHSSAAVQLSSYTVDKQALFAVNRSIRARSLAVAKSTDYSTLKLYKALLPNNIIEPIASPISACQLPIFLLLPLKDGFDGCW